MKKAPTGYIDYLRGLSEEEAHVTNFRSDLALRPPMTCAFHLDCVLNGGQVAGHPVHRRRVLHGQPVRMPLKAQVLDEDARVSV